MQNKGRKATVGLKAKQEVKRRRCHQCLLDYFQMESKEQPGKEGQPLEDLFNPLAPHESVLASRLLRAFRMRHEKHTQSSSVPQAPGAASQCSSRC